jgi:hypothetical protein
MSLKWSFTVTLPAHESVRVRTLRIGPVPGQLLLGLDDLVLSSRECGGWPDDPKPVPEGSHKVVSAGDWLQNLDLQVAQGLADANAVLLAEADQELEALLEHPAPGVIPRKVQFLVLPLFAAAE